MACRGMDDEEEGRGDEGMRGKLAIYVKKV
jgi:hypothetical protein